MARINAKIVDVWWHMNEGSERIHFTVEQAGGSVRRLYADRGSALYDVLSAYLEDEESDELVQEEAL